MNFISSIIETFKSFTVFEWIIYITAVMACYYIFNRLRRSFSEERLNHHVTCLVFAILTTVGLIAISVVRFILYKNINVFTILLTLYCIARIYCESINVVNYQNQHFKDSMKKKNSYIYLTIYEQELTFQLLGKVFHENKLYYVMLNQNELLKAVPNEQNIAPVTANIFEMIFDDETKRIKQVIHIKDKEKLDEIFAIYREQNSTK